MGIARNAVSKSNLSDEGRSSLSDRKHYFFMLSWICRKANTHVKYDPATGGHFLNFFFSWTRCSKMHYDHSINYKLATVLNSFRQLFDNVLSCLSPRAHLHMIGMLRFMFSTETNRACPLLFILILRLFLSLLLF